MAIDFLDTGSQLQEFDAEAAEKMAKEQQILDALQTLHPDCRIASYIAYNQKQLESHNKQRGVYDPANDGESGGALVLDYDLINPDGSLEQGRILINERTKPSLPSEVLDAVNIIGEEAMQRPIFYRYPEEGTLGDYYLG